jgi:hypothetical protein
VLKAVDVIVEDKAELTELMQKLVNMAGLITYQEWRQVDSLSCNLHLHFGFISFLCR